MPSDGARLSPLALTPRPSFDGCGHSLGTWPIWTRMKARQLLREKSLPGNENGHTWLWKVPSHESDPLCQVGNRIAARVVAIALSLNLLPATRNTSGVASSHVKRLRNVCTCCTRDALGNLALNPGCAEGVGLDIPG